MLCLSESFCFHFTEGKWIFWFSIYDRVLLQGWIIFTREQKLKEIVCYVKSMIYFEVWTASKIIFNPHTRMNAWSLLERGSCRAPGDFWLFNLYIAGLLYMCSLGGYMENAITQQMNSITSHVFTITSHKHTSSWHLKHKEGPILHTSAVFSRKNAAI